MVSLQYSANLGYKETGKERMCYYKVLFTGGVKCLSPKSLLIPSCRTGNRNGTENLKNGGGISLSRGSFVTSKSLHTCPFTTQYMFVCSGPSDACRPWGARPEDESAVQSQTPGRHLRRQCRVTLCSDSCEALSRAHGKGVGQECQTRGQIGSKRLFNTD